MQYISATDAKKTLGAVIAKAQREPIVIRKQNRDAAVIISPEDYERLTRLNIEEFQQFRAKVAAKAAARGLTEEKLNELLASDD
jgi:prevent-host-death family protein